MVSLTTLNSCVRCHYNCSCIVWITCSISVSGSVINRIRCPVRILRSTSSSISKDPGHSGIYRVNCNRNISSGNQCDIISSVHKRSGKTRSGNKESEYIVKTRTRIRRIFCRSKHIAERNRISGRNKIKLDNTSVCNGVCRDII
ncbi:hypothetical protein D3C80_914960 [compost metagenome]